LTEAYRRYNRKQMAEYYLKAEHHVTVMGSGDIREIRDRLQDTQAAVEGYRSIISKQAEEMVELRRKFDDMSEEFAEMKEKDKTISEISKGVIPILENPKVQAAIIEALKENPKIRDIVLRGG
jgi:uncharacterized coiled-coil DUF342 family protein